MTFNINIIVKYRRNTFQNRKNYFQKEKNSDVSWSWNIMSCKKRKNLLTRKNVDFRPKNSRSRQCSEIKWIIILFTLLVVQSHLFLLNWPWAVKNDSVINLFYCLKNFEMESKITICSRPNQFVPVGFFPLLY